MEKAQNLLGLCYFKLGLFDRAAELYEMLVRDNPVDPTLRVNLGLVYLKTSALQRAAREFETATDLAPEHQKAQNYLGLTLAQMGEYGRAREHFLLAGSDVMAEKMSRAIAGESYAKPPVAAASAQPKGRGGAEGAPGPARPAASPPPPAPPAPEPEEEEIRFAEDEGPSALSAEGTGEQEDAPSESTFDETSAAVAASAPLPPVPLTKLQLRRVPAESLGVAPAQGGAGSAHGAAEAGSDTVRDTDDALASRRDGAEARGAPAHDAVTTRGEAASGGGAAESRGGGASGLAAAEAASLAGLAASVVLEVADASRTFHEGPDGFTVAVDGELLTRLDGLVALGGQLTFQPEMKRFRGRATDKSFGDGATRMVRARGKGSLYLTPGAARTFLSVDLGEDSAYLRDECVFAFEEAVMFENGRVPSDIAPDLDLVHLRGQGRVLLSLPGPLRSVAVRQDQPVTVPLAHLVGWQGNLTPRMVPLLQAPTGETLRAGVELGGEGFALIALAVR
ncbi:hypothetical protein GCM10012319_41780 [Comamonas sp. KCTC 72670]|nr:hypothetical protein GCM10012319_41780 [Comamonas sp. KCTC 72670]